MQAVLEGLVSFATSNVAQWGYAAIFFLMLLESACIPIPSEAIMVYAGFEVATGRLDMLLAVLAGAAGNLVGSLVAYYVGRWGGRPFVLKYGKYILLHPKKVEMADHFFERYGQRAVFLSRLLPVIRTFISLPAGVAQMDVGKFSLYTFAGSVPWSWMLAYVGFLVGANWKWALHQLDKLNYVILAAVIIAVGAYAWRHARRRTNSAV